MDKNQKNLEITIVSDTKNDDKSYKELFASYNFIISHNLNYQVIESKEIKTKILLFDIKSINHLKIVNRIFQTKNYHIILLSPFSNMEILLKIKDFDGLIIYKPINFTMFEKIMIQLRSLVLKSLYLENKSNILSYLVDESVVRIGVFDIEGRFIYGNTQYLKANNLELFKQNITFNDMSNCNIEFSDIVYNLRKYNIFTTEKEKDSIWYKSHFYFIKNESYIVHICSNVSDVRLQIESLKKEALFFKQTNEGVLIADGDGYVESVNRAFCKITGYTKEEIIGKNASKLSSGMHDESFYNNMWESLKHYGAWQGEIWNRRKNGEIYPEWLSIVKSIDETTNKINYLALFTDISSLKEADKKIQFYANHDHLTGLINKAQFENMLKHTISSAKRHNRKFALLFIDLDHFKEVNDTYGHHVGDLLLKKVASRFQKILRKEDVIARIGGDEFNIILEEIENESDAIIIAQKLIETIKQPIVIEGNRCYVSLSVGVAIYPYHGEDRVELTKNADAAMYEVKKKGRDGVIVYESNFTQELLKKVSLQHDLKIAIENKDIEVYFQPVIDSDQKLISCEVLARWNHTKRGFVPPDEFITLAEKTGIIIPLAKVITQKTFEAIPLILSLVSKDFTFAINISAREFFDEEYFDNFVQMCKDFSIEPKTLELEITETHMMKNYTSAIEIMKKLQDLGFKISLDDFGTGYSSLNYLKLFPINKLKIDKSFIDKFIEDKSDAAIVKSIINLAKIFDLVVQAEGVETKKQLEALQGLNCDFYQGYYYSKPLPLQMFINYIKDFQ